MKVGLRPHLIIKLFLLIAFAVMLQPHDFDVEEKSRHKFMVQYMVAVGNTENLENIVRTFLFVFQVIVEYTGHG